MLSGDIPVRAQRLLREWIGLHATELAADWGRARRDEPLHTIAPLPWPEDGATMIEVTSVEVTDAARYGLRVAFNDGRSRDIDLTERLRDGGPVFRQLYDDPALFAQVYVDPEAATIVWPTGADLAPETLHGDQYTAMTARHR